VNVVFDLENHPIDNDSIAKMKKRSENGDPADYKAFLGAQKSANKTTKNTKK